MIEFQKVIFQIIDKFPLMHYLYPQNLNTAQFNLTTR